MKSLFVSQLVWMEIQDQVFSLSSWRRTVFSLAAVCLATLFPFFLLNQLVDRSIQIYADPRAPLTLSKGEAASRTSAANIKSENLLLDDFLLRFHSFRVKRKHATSSSSCRRRHRPRPRPLRSSLFNQPSFAFHFASDETLAPIG